MLCLGMWHVFGVEGVVTKVVARRLLYWAWLVAFFCGCVRLIGWLKAWCLLAARGGDVFARVV